MNISKDGINLIKSFEGYRNKSYNDGTGVWTIGWGTTKTNGKPVAKGMVCTQEQANEWLIADIKRFEVIVHKSVTVLLTQNMYDALVSFCYNLGRLGNNMKKYLNTEQYEKAADEFNLFIHAGDKKLEGLVKRRAKEKALFLKDMYIVPTSGITKKSNKLIIRWLQIKLNECLKNVNSYKALKVDGFYGSLTVHAVLAYWKLINWNNDKQLDGTAIGIKTVDALNANKVN